MTIQNIHITRFGGLSDFDLDLRDGVLVLWGPNESGKSSLAAFVKFIFYGLSPRAGRGGVSERQRYLSRETGDALGTLTLRTDAGVLWRIERSIAPGDGGVLRERIRMVNQSTGEVVTGEEPGIFFFGVPEEVYTGTAFVSQVSVRPESAASPMTGAKGAVENLLTSADENVDIRRAQKQLDDLRRSLSHKNGSGGEIAALRDERDALSAEREISAAKTAELLSLTASLDDIRRRIGELEEEKARHDGIFSALEKITLKRRIDAADETESQLSRLKSAIASLSSLPFGEGFEISLNDAEREIRAYDEQKAAFEERFPGEIGIPAEARPFPFHDPEKDEEEEEEEADENIPADGPLPRDILSRARPEDKYEPYEDTAALEMDTLSSVVGENIPDPRAAIGKVRRLAAHSRRELFLCLGLAAGAVLGLLAALGMAVKGYPAYLAPLVLSLLLMTTAVVVVIRHVNTAAELGDLLREWNAESAEEIEFAVRERLHVLERESAESGEKRRMLDVLEASRLKYGSAVSKIDAAAEKIGMEPADDVYETLRLLREKNASAGNDLNQLSARRSRLEGRLGVLREQLEDVNVSEAELEAHRILSTDWGREAAAMSQNDIKALIGEREFTDNALLAAEKRRASLEEKISAVGRVERTPDELDTALDSLDRRIEELSLRRDALELAGEAIREAGESLRRGVIPRIAAGASERLRAAGVRYDRLLLDDGFNCSLGEGGEVVPQSNFSRGTADMAYLSLRLALAEELFRGERPPAVLDECFAHMDAERTEGMLSTLKNARPDTSQTLVLTCRRDEADAAERLGIPVAQMEAV